LAGERAKLRGGDADAQSHIESWVRGYQPIPGIPDEFVDAAGRPRRHWMKLLGALARLEPEEISHRFAAADRRIRDMGMSYRVHGEARERSWPLSHMPLLVSQKDWETIRSGIEQRVDILERILADVYGPAQLVAEGALPAAAVAGSPDFVRAMRGVKPPGERWIRFYAADIGRGPDGRWWVLGDRAQAPSGAGYALENRLVLSRAFAGLYREMNVERLAPFFRDFRTGLADAAVRSEPRICLLTPGPWSETYFEQAYLARYLGMLLVEGEDFLMSDGRLHVRTIAGLKRADVIWRRVDADWCDPLELNAASQLGVPGMLEAIRRGEVVVANMPGAGLIESRALLAFLPALSRRILGEDLRLPNIATWWCGQERECESVLSNFDAMTISGAFSETVPKMQGVRSVLGADLSASERKALIASIRERGMDYAGQEVVRLSTTPVWDGGKLTPRPFTLRVFAAATPDGWRVMPGGFCRVSGSSDARAFHMGEGAQSADVWIIAEKPVEISTLLPAADHVKIVRLLGNLPSRAAHNLFWFGRYIERAEATLRLVRALCSRMTDADISAHGVRQSIERLQRMLAAWGATPIEAGEVSPKAVAAVLQSEEAYGSALSIARAARRAASVIRERLSQDAWQLVGRLENRLTSLEFGGASEPEIIERAEAALHTIAALSGLVNENMNRVAGWSFLDMGRRIERGINTCRFARQFADRDAHADQLDVLLDLIDSQITYHARYIAGVAPAPVRDMALLDPYNPRSVGFQVARLDEHLAALPVLREDGMLEAPRRIGMRLRADLAIEDADQLDTQKILAIEQRLMGLADSIGARYFIDSAQSGRGGRTEGLA
jgi:hypothetical protein